MTALAASIRPRRLDLPTGIAILGVLVGPLLVGTIAASTDGLRLAIAGGTTLLLLALGIFSPRALFFALVVWLFALGTTRRVVSLDTPRGALDPLLVVEPIAVAALVLAAVRSGAFRHRSALSNAVLVMSGLIGLAALNPLQGSLAAGVIGAVLLLTPLAGFWVGRSLDDTTFAQLAKVLAALGIVAAVYGLMQIFRGFPTWDKLWLTEFGYKALKVGDDIRPFSTFASSQEYVLFLAVALVVWVASARRLALLPAVAAGALIGASLFLASARGAVFATVAAVGALLFARLRVRPLLAAAGVVAAVLLVPPVTARLTPTSYGSTEVQDLLVHQVAGLADPFNSQASTLGLHLELARNGFESALREPLGVGPGPIGNAAQRLGGVGQPTELDPSNIAVALGLPGLLAYLVVLGLGLSRAYTLARLRRDRLALVALGMLAATLFQWFNGGLYLVALLSWLALGWVDRQTIRSSAA
jgi:hypothetical protein